MIARQEIDNASSVKSQHVSDAALEPFLMPSFDPADFLNATLPPLSVSTTSSQPLRHAPIPLAELSTQTQTLLSHLGAHTTRLSNALTQLTDEILRSSSRLAYEVEVLRGETLGLSEMLADNLKDDVEKFVPKGVSATVAEHTSPLTRQRKSSTPRPDTPKATSSATLEETSEPSLPPYITQLRTLSLVKNRLESVIKVFGDAMDWTLPPSEVSIASSFISVSAPEPGSESHSREEKGQEVSKKLRDEIAGLLLHTMDGEDGLKSATQRVEELRDLATVWKGTAEEKARGKFVDGLAKMVEDRRKELERQGDAAGMRESSPARPANGLRKQTERLGRGVEPGDPNEQGRFSGGYGLINQLQRMRTGM
jgi:hypothetical protein